jgi:PRC-barrel domain
MPDIDTVRGWQGATLVGSDGDKIGSIDSIHLDDQTGEPEWALVNTGFFGTKSSFVPLARPAPPGTRSRSPTTSSWSRTPPGIDPDQHLAEAE